RRRLPDADGVAVPHVPGGDPDRLRQDRRLPARPGHGAWAPVGGLAGLIGRPRGRGGAAPYPRPRPRHWPGRRSNLVRRTPRRHWARYAAPDDPLASSRAALPAHLTRFLPDSRRLVRPRSPWD